MVVFTEPIGAEPRMRINQHKRIYMNEEGSSPGGGAASPAPTQPAAQPASSETPPVDAIKAAMNELIGGFRTEMTSWKNQVFADLRKSGALGKDKPLETPSDPKPAATPSPAPAAASLTMDQVEAMLEQTRVIERAAVENGLNDAQVRRMRLALKAEGPDDVASWTKAYLADMGLAKATTQPNSNPTAPNPAVQPSTQPPVSDKGSPAPGGVVNWEAEFMRDPLRMSPAAKAAMAAKHGDTKARQMRLERIAAMAGQIRVTVT